MLSAAAPELVARRLKREVERNALRVRNGLRHFGEVSPPVLAQSPRTEVWSRDKARLYRYDSSVRTSAVPVLLVYSLVGRPQVFDLSPGNSMIEAMLARGLDVYLLDWGVPDAVDSENGLETYCDEYIPSAVQAVLTSSDAAELTVLGYCLGGVLSALAVAGHPQLPVRNLILQATPVLFAPLGPACKMFRDERLDPEDFLDETGNVPTSTMLAALRMPNPTKHLVAYKDLWDKLHNDEHVAAYQVIIGWSNEHIPLPGRVFRQVIELFIRREALATGRVPLGAREVYLADISCSVLVVIAEHDDLVPAASSAPMVGLLTGADVDTLSVPAGHVGLMVGRKAHSQFIPQTLDWITAHSS